MIEDRRGPWHLQGPDAIGCLGRKDRSTTVGCKNVRGGTKMRKGNTHELARTMGGVSSLPGRPRCHDLRFPS